VTVTAFREWLEREGYGPGTIRKYTQDLQSYFRDPTVAHDVSRQRAHDYARAYRLYETVFGKPRRIPRPPDPPPASKRRGPRSKRRVRDTLDDRQWRALKRAIDEDESPAAYALAVLIATGLRCADLLRVERDELRRAHRRSDGAIRIRVKGGLEVASTTDAAPRAWNDLREAIERARSSNVAAFVATGNDPNPEADGAASKALRRTLKRLAQQAGLRRRVHLHLLRHTLANRLIARGASLEEVQHLLGHVSRRTTERYTRDAQARLAAQALKRLNED